MSDLKEIQNSFAKSIYDGDDKDILSVMKVESGGDEAANVDRMQIYKDNVLITLFETLKDTYSIVCKLVGEEFFRYCVNEYVKMHKPESGNLHDYGEEFPEFLKEFTPTKELKYLPDIAMMQYYMDLAYFAADNEKIDRNKLAAVPPEQLENLKFKLHPSVYLVSSDYPLDKIKDMVEKSDDGDDQAGGEQINLDQGGVNLLVVRPEYEVNLIVISDAEYEFLRNIKEGKGLFESFEQAIAKDESFDISKAIAKFVDNGSFAGFSL